MRLVLSLAGLGVEVEKLASAAGVVQKHAAERRGRRDRPGNLDAAHFHTQVPRVQDHADTRFSL